MTRKSQAASPQPGITFTTFICAALAAAAFAAPAQAAKIGFEEGYGALYGSGDFYTEAGYRFEFESPHADSEGSLVGANMDGSDPSWCANMACPTSNSGAFYGTLNDSMVYVGAENGNPFRLLGFDASFIGRSTDLGSYLPTVGLIEVLGLTTDGAVVGDDFWLNGPGNDGFSFQSFLSSSLFDNTFLLLQMTAYACLGDGFCYRGSTNMAQFGLDNMQLVDAGAAEVPEPATGLIFGLGLMGLVAAARRRNA